MPERIAESDVELLQSAQAELAAAQNVVGFVQAHIGRTYKLKAGDVITATGEIVRAPEPPTP